MSKYTTEIRYIVEQVNIDKGVNIETTPIPTLISNARSTIFPYNYPLDRNFKADIENAIILHFYAREIGYETVGLFTLKLYERMLSNTEKYNQLLRSALYTSDVLGNSNEVETIERENKGTSRSRSDSTNISTNKNRSVFSDTPQGILSSAGDYATNLTDDNGQATTTYNGTDDSSVNNVENVIRKISGLSGQSLTSAVIEFQKRYLTIYNIIYEDLNDLFMGLW